MTRIQTNRLALLTSAAVALLAAALPGRGRAQARDLLEPDVMLLIDSSGSMDWRDNTGRPAELGAWDWARLACEADAYNPADRTSWQKLQDAFLGKLDERTYRCAVHAPIQRPSLHALTDETISDFVPDNITEFSDVAYPHFYSLSCPDGMWQGSEVGGYDQCIDASGAVTRVSDGVTYCREADIYAGRCLNMHPEANPRKNNGILDAFGATVRFGAMTYDNMPKCWKDCDTDRHATGWDYGHYRHWRCDGMDETGVADPSGIGAICYDWNAGARGGERDGYRGAVGGLVGIGDEAESTNDDVADLLDSMEPLFCSPLGALLDDAGYYFANDPRVLPASPFNNAAGQDRYYRCRPKIALLITDGRPTSTFEFAAGTCTDDGLSEWDPVSANVSRISHESRNGPPFANLGDGALLDTAIFDCPWRSSPEEAGEIFDVGVRALQSLGITDTVACEPPDCWPVFLVVVGFNVPDDSEVDCAVDPDACYYYTPRYERCWKGLPECVQDADAGADETLCPMTPRQFLNEIACQGWPYDTAESLVNNYGAGGQASHSTNFQPPWLSADNDYCAGGEICRRDPSGQWVERALFVDDVDELAAVLDLILVEMSSNVVTRTDIVTWNKPSVTGFVPADVAQYEFLSGYVARSGRPWKGVLTRVDKDCRTDVSDTRHNVAEYIADQTARKIYTYVDTMSYAYDEPDLNEISLWLNQGTFGGDGLQELSELDDCDYDVGATVGNPDACLNRREVAAIIEEETLSRGLADIFNSTPALLGPPFDRIPVASYAAYRAAGAGALTNGARPPYLFVGTNDGVLHAVDVEEISRGSGAQPERWGFIPKSLLQELLAIYPIPRIRVTRNGDGDVIGYTVDENTGTGLYRHEFLLDGPPVARDVLLIRPTAALSTEVESEAWRAVVFGSGGRNTRTHYALDVTDNLRDPTNHPTPKLRFEIAPDHGLFGNNTDAGARAALRRIGMPMSKPALAYVRQQVGSDKVETVVGAAIVPGGYKADPDPNAMAPESNGSTGVYVLRLADGQLIRYLDPMNADADICDYGSGAGLIRETGAGAGGGDLFYDGAQLVGEPVVPRGTRSLQVSTHAFIGDDRGRVWLIDMQDPDPARWCLSLYFDTLVSWHYPYADCVDTAGNPCTSSDDCVWTDCCKEDDGQLPCDYLARNMKAPRAYLIGAPTIATDEQNRDVLIFGTGQYDALTSWNRNRVFSVTDTTSLVDNRVVHTPVINWWIGDDVPAGDFFQGLPSTASATQALLTSIDTAMKGGTQFSPAEEVDEDGADTEGADTAEGPQAFWNVGEKLIGRPVIFDGVTYFTTYIPLNDRENTQDACDEGASRVWALDYNTYNRDAETTEESYIGKFFIDEEWAPYRTFNHQVLSGVQVVKKPQCGASDEAIFELVVQKANRDADTSGGGAPPEDAVLSQSIPISTRSNTSLVSVRFDSWSIVF